MTEEERFKARLTGDNDQDRAMCEEWWFKSPAHVKFAVWEVIIKKYDDPAMEVMSRLAQLKFCEMTELHGLLSRSKSQTDGQKGE